MTDASSQPRLFDAVLGGLQPPPVNAAVLGGIEGVKYRFNSPIEAHKILALKDALNYGEAGIELAIAALDHKSEQVKKAAYSLLFTNPTTRPKIFSSGHNPYRFFECLETLPLAIDIKLRELISLNSNAVAFLSSKRQIQVNCIYPFSDTKTICELPIKNVMGGFIDFSLIQISEDSNIIAAAGGEYFSLYVGVCNFSNNQKTFTKFKAHIEPITSIAIAPDNSFFVTASKDKTIAVWDSNKLSHCLQSFSAISDHGSKIAIAPNCKIIASIDCNRGSRHIRFWDIKLGKLIRSLISQWSEPTAIATSPDSSFIVAGYFDGSIKIYDIETGKTLQTIAGSIDWISAILIFPDSKIIATGDFNGIIHVWEIATQKLLQTFTDHCNRFLHTKIIDIKLSNDQTKIIASSCNNTVKIWGIPEIV